MIKKNTPTAIFCVFIIVLWASSAFSCPLTTDLDGDCKITFADLVLFAEQWLAPAGCVGFSDACADFVGEDGVNLDDLSLLAREWGLQYEQIPPIVINEIHFDPDLSYELVEFVELHNAGDQPVDLSGWYFGSGITYTFPPNTLLAAGDYLVVTEDASVRTIAPLTSVQSKYGTPPSKVFGPFSGSLSNDGETIQLRAANGLVVDEVDYQLGFPWPTVGDGVSGPGTGHSIQLVNPAFNNHRGGNWRSAYPTPGAANTAVYAENLPPIIRQVSHTPKQPKAGEIVTITAKVTDPDGVASVTLYGQIVNPGNYIPITLPNYSTTTPTLPNPAYENPANWSAIAMNDDGVNGDAVAGDGIYTAQVSAGVQVHRRLIRYRITAVDNGSRSLTVPYPDDPQPNFAYFVYDGVPSWTGDGATYNSEMLTSLPVYHLISRNSDVEACFWNSAWDDGKYHFAGTLIYDGKVYDHIYYHIRGQASTFMWGKNKCRFRFNRGHYFQARDDYGNTYDNTWDNLVLGTGTCPWWKYPHPDGPWDQGTGGMLLNEPLSYRIYNMVGVPAPNTNYFHFRVIDAAAESGPTQYDGDFWGLYFAVEDPDRRFLREHDLEDGNVYKMENGFADRRNQSATQVTDKSDVSAFVNAQNATSSQTWWENNVDLDGYYRFRTAGIVMNNSDPRAQENCFYYRDPITNQWSIHPWDLDLTYEWGSHYEPWRWENIRHCLQYPALNLAYENRARELVDLLFDNNHYGWRQTDQLVDELAAVIAASYNGRRFVDAEQAMWNNHPKVSSRYKNLWYKHNEFFAQPGRAENWDNMVAYYKQFLTPEGMSGFLSGSYGLHSLLSVIADPAIPHTPSVTYIGAENFPINDLKFQTSAFSDPQGSGTFAALKWRIAEVEPYTPVTPPDDQQPQTIDLITENEIWKYYRAISGEPSDPVSAWRTLSFDDTDWQIGQTSIGYGDNDDLTDLSQQTPPMRYNYTTIYLRKTFEVTNLEDIESFAMRVYVDDGCIIWINGTQVARQNCTSEFKAWDATNGTGYVEPTWYTISLPTPTDYFVEGQNIIAVHVLNDNLTSSDLSIDLTLKATYAAEPSEPAPFQKVKRGKYEIETLWESPAITDPSQLTVKIPAGVVRTDRLYRVRSRMRDNSGRWSHWSDPIQFTTGRPLSVGILEDLRLTEMMYHPAPANLAKGEPDIDKNEFEFIELKNISPDETLDLSYVALTRGVTFDFADSAVTTLQPGEFVLVVRNAAAFNLRYPGLADRIAGEYSGRLSNDGERITLVDSINGVIADFEYNDSFGWPAAADGAGHSLVPLETALPGQPDGSLNYNGNWRQSTRIHGSPGADDPAPAASLLVNEVMAHTDYPNSQLTSNDWIELYNPTGADMAYDDRWYLSDDPTDLKKWALPEGVVPAGGWVSFDQVSGFNFGLSKEGEYVFLSYLPGTAEDRVLDCLKFGGQENSISWGRFPDGDQRWFFLAAPGTRGAANADPIQPPVVISEIMYHPTRDTDDDEYLELYNPTGATVNLYNQEGSWRLDSGISYVFPMPLSIPAGGRIVIVGFDPTVETARLAAFNTTYGSSLTAGTDIFGPWSGNLSNSGERIDLQEPQDMGTWWITVDQVIYSDYAPWPVSPDGDGEALVRLSSAPTASGNDPTNWTAATPSPGY